MARVNQEGGLIDIITMVDNNGVDKKQISKVEATVGDKKLSNQMNHAVPSLNAQHPQLTKKGTQMLTPIATERTHDEDLPSSKRKDQKQEIELKGENSSK